MSFSEWFAGAGLIFTIAASAAGVIFKLGSNKNELLLAIKRERFSIDEELAKIKDHYMTLIQKAYLEMGEAPKALREKVSQIEMFMRDTFLLKTEYYRDQDQLLDTIKSIGVNIERRFDSLEKRLEDKNG